jgi:ribosome-binding factor A
VSFRGRRGLRSPHRDVVCPEDELDPGLFFDEARRSRKSSRKVGQLCKQVERAVVVTLADWGGDEVAEAWVQAVEPAPDAGRLRITVVLGPAQGTGDLDAARAAFVRATPAFRNGVARSIHRKRVPEIVFEVRLAAEVRRD